MHIFRNFSFMHVINLKGRIYSKYSIVVFYVFHKKVSAVLDINYINMRSFCV